MLSVRVFSYIKRRLDRFFLVKQNKNRLFLGNNVYWRSSFSVIVENQGQLKIGNDCLFNFDCSITCLGKITIGNSSIFGEGVKIYEHNHKFNRKNRTISEQGMAIGEVNIGNNCWIGSNVIILKGADIGDNCVVGAGAIISGKIPDNTLVRTKNNYATETIQFKD